MMSFLKCLFNSKMSFISFGSMKKQLKGFGYDVFCSGSTTSPNGFEFDKTYGITGKGKHGLDFEGDIDGRGHWDSSILITNSKNIKYDGYTQPSAKVAKYLETHYTILPTV